MKLALLMLVFASLLNAGTFLPFPCYDTNANDPYRTPFNVGICAVNSNVTSGVESTVWQCLATDSVNAVPFGYSASDTLSVGCVCYKPGCTALSR